MFKADFRLNNFYVILIQVGFVDYKHFMSTDFYSHYNNSKKTICIPEQFYFNQNHGLEGSVDGDIIINKSCNRCQRFLPINHINERFQLAFSNHCSTKAPCTHGNFSNYQIESSHLTSEELIKFLETTPYKFKDNFVISYYGHQLECKACRVIFKGCAVVAKKAVI